MRHSGRLTSAVIGFVSPTANGGRALTRRGIVVPGAISGKTRRDTTSVDPSGWDVMVGSPAVLAPVGSCNDPATYVKPFGRFTVKSATVPPGRVEASRAENGTPAGLVVVRSPSAAAPRSSSSHAASPASKIPRNRSARVTGGSSSASNLIN